MRCIDRTLPLARAAGLATVFWLGGCGVQPTQNTSTTPERAQAPAATPAPSAAAPSNARVSLATSERAYRQDGARAIYAAYPDSIYKGKLPPLLHAVVVVETEVDSRGNVRDVRMIRTPSHAPEVVTRVRELIRKASPLPAPSRLGSVKYTDVWLVDKSGRFQLDTLTEGQL